MMELVKGKVGKRGNRVKEENRKREKGEKVN